MQRNIPKNHAAEMGFVAILFVIWAWHLGQFMSIGLGPSYCFLAYLNIWIL